MIEDYDTNDDGVKLHLRESEALRKQWVTYVFNAVQKLHDRVEANTLQVQKEREEYFHKLVELKEKLEEQLKTASKEQAQELQKIDNKLTAFIKDVADNFANVNECVDDSIEEQSTKNDLTLKELKDYMDTEIKSLNERMTENETSQQVVKAKVGVYVALVTLGTTTVLGVLASSALIMFKDSIRAWLGL